MELGIAMGTDRLLEDPLGTEKGAAYNLHIAKDVP